MSLSLYTFFALVHSLTQSDINQIKKILVFVHPNFRGFPSPFFSLAATSQTQRNRLTDFERPLLDALVADDKLEHPRRRYACTGRFLTMHKRRRKKLTTRTLIHDTAILDDVHHGQVQCILNQVGNWKFNAFALETVTGGE